MTTALIERPLSFLAGARDVRSGGRRLTLEQRLQEPWDGLRLEGAADCPVCRARMVARERGGACGSCGAQLT